MAGMETVSCSVDGSRIRGTLHMPSGRKKKPAVLMCHGFTGNRMETHFIFVKLSRMLEERGIASLRFDFRGSGESEGRFEDMTVVTEIKDARRMLGVLSRTKGVDGERIGLLGFSLGGCVAACVSPDKRVRSLALWSPVGDLRARLKERMTKPMKAALRAVRYVDVGGLKVGKAFYSDAGKVDAVGSVSKCIAPVLVVHGTDDETVSMDHGEALYAAARKRGIRTRMEVIGGGGHTYADVHHEKKVLNVTCRWFQDTL